MAPAAFAGAVYFLPICDSARYQPHLAGTPMVQRESNLFFPIELRNLFGKVCQRRAAAQRKECHVSFPPCPCLRSSGAGCASSCFLRRDTAAPHASCQNRPWILERPVAGVYCPRLVLCKLVFRPYQDLRLSQRRQMVRFRVHDRHRRFLRRTLRLAQKTRARRVIVMRRHLPICRVFAQRHTPPPTVFHPRRTDP